MAGKITRQRPPYAYRHRKTILHRVPAGIKLICMIAISVAACSSPYGLAASIPLVIILSLIARIPFWELFRGSKPLVVISLFVIIVKTINIDWGLGTGDWGLGIGGRAEFTDAVITVLRIFTPLAAASLFFAVTTMRELRLSVTAFELRLRRKKTGVSSFGLGIGLMMGFIPRFFNFWEMSNIACDARSCKRGPRRMLILIPLVIERMMAAAADTALAVEARNFGINQDEESKDITQRH
jgi:energy-coupling factor transporter transmembrane protein EcfT